MGRLIASFCCLVVGLQILVGVPLAVCIAFLCLVESGSLGRIIVEVRHVREAPDAAVPAADLQLPQSASSLSAVQTDFSAILESRAQCGNPFAGTSLADETNDPTCQSDFVAALRQIAADEGIGVAPAPYELTAPPSGAPALGYLHNSPSEALNPCLGPLLAN